MYIRSARKGTEYSVWVGKLGTLCDGICQTLSVDSSRQGMCVQHDIEVRSCNHCCSGEAVCVLYSECPSVALVIGHAMCMRLIVASLALLSFSSPN